MLSAFFFFFNDTATTEIYTLSLHDALPISARAQRAEGLDSVYGLFPVLRERRTQLAGSLSGGEQQMLAIGRGLDRKSTRLNSSHGYISYAVFCLKKKKERSS